MRSLSDAFHPTRRWIVLLAAAEWVVLLLVFYAAAWLRFLGDTELMAQAFGDVGKRALVFASIQVAAMVAMGMYVAHSREGLNGYAVRALVAFVGGGLVLIALQYAMPFNPIGRGVLFPALFLGFCAIVLMRMLAAWGVRADLLQRRVLVIGAGNKAALIESKLGSTRCWRTMTILGYVPLAGDAERIAPEQQIAAPDGILALARSLDIDELVIAPDDRRGTLPMDDLMQCRLEGMVLNEVGTFLENETGRIQFSVVNPSWVLFAEGFDSGAVRAASKRLFDVTAAAILLLLTLPVMLLTALLILLESGFRGPIFYRQERVGQAGRCFQVLKFRSMRTDAEKDGVARWASSNDDRVTRVGRVIRKLRIDELPQVINVFSGEMSFVGPRPERPPFVDQLSQSIPYYALRHAVKPGITGWAQLRYAYGASVEDAREKLKYDLYYVKNHSFMFDLLVLLQTVEVILFGKGAR
ncbi:MAG: TIGR03013 family PEP-CTERM/XrtA system glycosyltransferase [Rhodanobacteraceae bacterium]|nr:TIGR03013 family PEP-CTERM/XrtA system glycosyltransferase [Rhodanobacteraceae bacterium]